RPVIDGDITAVGFFVPVTKTPIGDPTTAPTDPKTPFSQVLNVIVPETLPDPYGIVAVVVNPKAGEVTGCALSIVGSAKSPDLDYYPIPL
ncbi:14110_t:CDS:1, partial [Entrophospora sp. SA101]